MPPKRKGAVVKDKKEAPPAKKIKGSKTGISVSSDPIIDDYDAWYYCVESFPWSEHCVPYKLTQEEYDNIKEEVIQELAAEKISNACVKHWQKQFN